jgi:hypothetical protein
MAEFREAQREQGAGKEREDEIQPNATGRTF